MTMRLRGLNSLLLLVFQVAFVKRLSAGGRKKSLLIFQKSGEPAELCERVPDRTRKFSHLSSAKLDNAPSINHLE